MTDLASIPEERRVAVIQMRAAAEYGEGPDRFMPGSWSVRILGELVTELGIRLDGDESLLAHYDINFNAPVYGGDYLRYRGEIVKIGNTSRTIDFTVDKIIEHNRPDLYESAADLLETPKRVITGRAVIVVPKDLQRKPF